MSTEDRLSSALAARAAEVEPEADAFARLASRRERAGRRPLVWGLAAAAVVAVIALIAGMLVLRGSTEVDGDGLVVSGGDQEDGAETPTPEVAEGTEPVWPTDEIAIVPTAWPASPEAAVDEFVRDVLDSSVDRIESYEQAPKGFGATHIANVRLTDGREARLGLIRIGRLGEERHGVVSALVDAGEVAQFGHATWLERDGSVAWLSVSGPARPGNPPPAEPTLPPGTGVAIDVGSGPPYEDEFWEAEVLSLAGESLVAGEPERDTGVMRLPLTPTGDDEPVLLVTRLWSDASHSGVPATAVEVIWIGQVRGP